MLVFTADLEEVEEIGCSGMDGDEVLFVCWDWIREGGYAEVFWSLGYSD